MPVKIAARKKGLPKWIVARMANAAKKDMMVKTAVKNPD